MHGDDILWGLPEHLLAMIADAVNAANWQRSAKKGSKPPKRIPRPGVKDGRKKKTFGGDVVRTPAELDAIFAEAETPEEVNDGR